MNTRQPDVVNMLFGSHLYGLADETSDYDFKGIYLPTLKELLLGDYPKTYKFSTGKPHEKNTAGDIDSEVIALPRFIEFALQGETLALDMLHCEEPLSTSPIWEDLVANRKRFYSKSLKAFVGYVKRQAAKYGVKGSRLADIQKAVEYLKRCQRESLSESLTLQDVWAGLPEGEFLKKLDYDCVKGGAMAFYEVNNRKYQINLPVRTTIDKLNSMYSNYGERAKLAEKNDGVDWKAMSHALRAAMQAFYIYTEGDFSYPLPDTFFLRQVKRGKLDFKTVVLPKLEHLADKVEHLASVSTLPEKADRAFWQNWLLRVYQEKYNITIR